MNIKWKTDTQSRYSHAVVLYAIQTKTPFWILQTKIIQNTKQMIYKSLQQIDRWHFLTKLMNVFYLKDFLSAADIQTVNAFFSLLPWLQMWAEPVIKTPLPTIC